MRFRSMAFLFGFVLTAVGALAQTETGRISGTVTDPQGGVVPGVTVTATNVGTGAVRSTVTESSGQYVIANVLPAPYEVKFELSGFKTVTTRITVSVGGDSAADAKLEVGALTETVSVTAAPEVINVRTPEVKTVVNEAQIKELPTLTRNPYDLVGLAGNVSDQDPTGRGTGFAINGMRAAATNTLLDGAANNDEFTASVGMSVPLDTVQEFSVISSNFSAQYGRATSGIVNVAVKAGSNSFHGSGYEFFRNEKMASFTFDQKERCAADPGSSICTKDPFNRNQPGFSVGGPIVKDKAQFFVGAEFTRVRSSKTDIALVPTAEFLARTAPNTQAFFAKFPLAAKSSGQLVRRSAIAGNPGGPFASLPADLPIFQQVEQLLPIDAGGGIPQDAQQIVGRVDWTLGNNSSAYIRYAWQHEVDEIGSNSNSPYAGFSTPTTNNNHNALFSLTRVWGPTFTSQSKVVFNRLKNDQPLGDQPDVPLLILRSSTTRINNLRIALPGYLPYSGGSSAIPFGGPQNLFQIYQDQTWLKGNHDVRFGGSYVRIMDNRTFGAYENSVQTLGSNLPNALDNLIRGQLLNFQGAVDPQGKFPGQVITLPAKSPNFTRNNRYNEWAAYVNDSWRLRSNVTASLGVRYEYYGVQHNTDPSLDSNFYYGPGSTVPETIRNGSVQIAQNSPVGDLWGPDRNNFAPRLGIAWDVNGDGRTSIRGGYGIGYERNFGNVTFNVIQNPPAYAVVTLVAGTDVPTIPLSSDNAGPLAGTGSKVLPSVQLRHVDQNIKNAYAHFWSASFQQQLAARTVASIEYTGSAGENQYSIIRQNIPFSGLHYLGSLAATPTGGTSNRENGTYTNLNSRANAGYSRYNGVTFAIENRVQSGLSFTGRYTLSTAKDTLSSTFSESGNNFNLGQLDPYDPGLDYGYADYDVRHRLAASAIWNIPGPTSGAMKQVAGGWQVNVIYTAQSGSPFSIFDCENSVTLCPRLLRVGTLPSVNSNPSAVAGEPNTYAYLDLTSQHAGVGSYADPKTGVSDFGPFPSNMIERNMFRKPGRWNMDTVFAKRFTWGTGNSAQLRFELYNLFAHANLNVNLDDSDISSGEVVHAFYGDTGPGDGVSAGDGQRRFQFGVRFEF